MSNLLPAPGSRGVTINNPVYGQIIQGAWYCICPCGTGSLCDGSTTIMFCPECQNADIMGQWRIVVMPTPERIQTIENVLGARPIEARNWTHGVALAELMVENLQHGDMLGAD